MSATLTPNFRLPLLATGQANKELTHNEALILLDWLAHPVIGAVANDPALLAPEPGQAWLIGTGGIGAWSGRDHHLALWSEGGWRYIEPSPGLLVFDLAEAGYRRFDGSDWTGPNMLTMPSGGTVIDAEARAALQQLMTEMSIYGLIKIQ